MPGWAQFIKASKLNIKYGDKCVLGQLYSGHYDMGEAVLFGRDRSFAQATRDARRHGLCRGWFSSNERLTAEWVQIVQIRQFDAARIEEVCPALAPKQEKVEQE
jgi:hypothetical protein